MERIRRPRALVCPEIRSNVLHGPAGGVKDGIRLPHPVRHHLVGHPHPRRVVYHKQVQLVRKDGIIRSNAVKKGPRIPVRFVLLYLFLYEHLDLGVWQVVPRGKYVAIMQVQQRARRLILQVGRVFVYVRDPYPVVLRQIGTDSADGLVGRLQGLRPLAHLPGIRTVCHYPQGIEIRYERDRCAGARRPGRRDCGKCGLSLRCVQRLDPVHLCTDPIVNAALIIHCTSLGLAMCIHCGSKARHKCDQRHCGDGKPHGSCICT